MTQSRMFGYVQASANADVESAEAQVQIIERYCKRLGRRVDAIYSDRPSSEDLRLFDREAGKRLMLALRRGDHVIVARVDRLDASLKGFTRVLEAWSKLSVVTHVCDMPITVLDPSHPQCGLLIQILIKFAERERRMLGQRTKQGLAVLRSENRRYCRNAPYGYQWQRRGTQLVLTVDETERATCMRAAEQRAKGYSIDEIRQFLSYELKARNRAGREFTKSAVYNMAVLGAKWLKSKPAQRA
jgi:site-specific DNA recombinase